MNDVNLLLAVFLLVNLLIALLRVARGPTDADRLLAVLLFGTIGVAILLLLAFTEDASALIDVALVFALLAAITGAVFAQRTWRQEEEKDEYS